MDAIFPARWGIATPALIVDTREQTPLDVSAWPGGTVTRKLDFGDYALDGFDTLDRPGAQVKGSKRGGKHERLVLWQ